LQTTCEKLRIPFDDWLTLSEEMQRLARPHAQGVLEGDPHPRRWGRGYSTAGCVSPTRILSVSPFPAHYARWREEGITLTQSPVPWGATLACRPEAS
jgi:4-amino-4-deoxychorismate lyase